MGSRRTSFSSQSLLAHKSKSQLTDRIKAGISCQQPSNTFKLSSNSPPPEQRAHTQQIGSTCIYLASA